MKSLKKVLLVGDAEFTDKFKGNMINIEPFVDFYAIKDIREIGNKPLSSNFKIIKSMFNHYDSVTELQVQQWAHLNNLSYLRIHFNIDEVIIGPLTMKNKPGCLKCQIYRQDNASNPYVQRENVNFNNKQTKSFILSYLHLCVICIFVKSELRRIEQYKQTLTFNNIYRISMKTLNSRYHRFMPNPRCNYCNQLPEDRKENVILDLKPQYMNKENVYRVDNYKLSLNNLRTTLLDKRQGVITSLSSYTNEFLPVSIGQRALHNSHKNDPSIGKEITFNMSETVSYLECLERKAGSHPQGKNVTTFESYSKLKDDAIHPKEFGLYSQEQYSLDNFKLNPFDNDEPISWVWAYSFKLQKPVLVPEDIAYFGDYDRKTERFVLESSNGCALGGCMEEAILHGLFEVVERDAFLLMWYAKLNCQSINLERIDDDYVYYLYQSIEKLGYKVFVYNTTTDINIPSFAAFCVNSKFEAPYLFTSAGTHIDPIKAIRGALQEVAAHAQNARFIYFNNKERISLLSKDTQQISTIEDHYLFYYDPLNRGELDFLLKGEKNKVDINTLFYNPIHFNNITDYVDLFVDRIIRLGFDVIVVDQTPHLEIYKDQNLSAVKVLIPGTLPPAFGMNNDRVFELDRVYNYPVKIGLKKEKLTKNDLNRSLHPFA